MSDFTRRVNRLSKWFEKRRHALAFDFVFARVHKTLWLDPAMAADVVITSWSEKIAFPLSVCCAAQHDGVTW
jgi:hypothetical protein